MRILYDHQVFSLQNAGGISRYHIELLRNLAQHDGVYPELLVGLHNSIFNLQGLGDAPVWARRVGAVGPRLRYAINEGFSFLKLAAETGRFDVYHPTLYRSVKGVRAHKVVATHHDCLYERYPHLFSRAAMVRRCKAELFRRADRIICISESSRRDLHHFYEVDEMKTCVVHHGVTPLELPSTPSAVSTRPYLLYVGARPAYKNFEGLLRGFVQSSASREFELVAAGGDPFTARERDLIAHLRLDGRVHHRPAPTNGLLAALYAQAHLFVYPSFYEGFGFPPLEAMLLDTPVLASDTSCIPEICREGVFYFDPHQPESLGAMLDRACFDEEARSAMRKQGKVVARKYSWEECGRRTLHVYRS